MNSRILFVDDEPLVLEALSRQLRGRYDIFTSSGPNEALDTLAEEGPFAVVVSDMQMPVMNGVELLREVRTQDPDAVRMILSGRSDMELTVAAVNEGSVFRFLTKPCGIDRLVSALDDAVRQHQLVVAERQLLEQTLYGAVQLLTDVLAMVSPTTYSRASRVQRVMDQLLEHLVVPDAWEVRLAGRLSLIGCLSVPDDLLSKAFAGKPLEPDEAEVFEQHPQAAKRLLERIPRLEGVARIVGSQLQNNPEPLPADTSLWTPDVLGAKVLDVAIRFSEMLSEGLGRGEAYGRIRDTLNLHPTLLAALGRVQIEGGAEAWVTVAGLRPGMILDQEVTNQEGTLLLASGHEVTDAIILRLQSHASRGGVSEPIRVRAGEDQGEGEPAPAAAARSAGRHELVPGD